jgi:hypothetical protein
MFEENFMLSGHADSIANINSGVETFVPLLVAC